MAASAPDRRRTPQALARAAYAVLLVAAIPFFLLKLWWRGRAEPAYRQAVGERFGRYGDAASTGWVWVHAVSLGETRAADALVEALRAQLPGMKLLLTHGTATGRAAGRALLREGDRQCWLPYDTPGAVRRFFAHFRPTVGVLMETEIWPNLLAAARRAGVPVALANARLGERSLARGAHVAALLRPAYESLGPVLAQTGDDAVRLKEAGAREVQVAGNLKFDMSPDPALVAIGRRWRRLAGRPVIVASSTRDGEEAELVDAWRDLAAPRPLLVVVPRHPQRFDEAAALLAIAGLRYARRSTWGDRPPAEALALDAWLGDSMGEMPLYYALADAALLGGSFAPFGGQNLIEAAACGCPVVMGPHTFNFAEAARLAAAAGAAVRVATLADGVDVASRRLARQSAAERLAQAERCHAFAARHRGAASQMAARIAALVP